MSAGPDVQLQRAWARVAGLMYWVVLIADLSGMQLHSAVGRSLSLAGALCTIPLAFGLYYALKPQGSLLARSALVSRLLEATLGAISVIAGYQSMQAGWNGTSVGRSFLHLANWDDRTSFAAFLFSIGSTLFFYLFVRSVYIPRILAWWGLFASVLAFAACGLHLLHSSFPAMTMYAWTPMLLAETSTGLWLLVRSVKVTTLRSADPPHTVFSTTANSYKP